MSYLPDKQQMRQMAVTTSKTIITAMPIIAVYSGLDWIHENTCSGVISGSDSEIQDRIQMLLLQILGFCPNTHIY